MKTLQSFYSEYEEIISSNAVAAQKDAKLASLMTEMERTFKIPALRDIAWEDANKPVIALYRIISRSRRAYNVVK